MVASEGGIPSLVDLAGRASQDEGQAIGVLRKVAAASAAHAVES